MLSFVAILSAAFRQTSALSLAVSPCARARAHAREAAAQVKLIGWGTDSGQDYWLVANRRACLQGSVGYSFKVVECYTGEYG